MSDTTRSIDFGKSFTFMFKDPKWLTKIALGGVFYLLSFLLIGVPFLLGYFRRVFLAAVADPDTLLPEWDPGSDFSNGLPALGVILCYTMPIVIISFVPCVGWCVSLPLSLVIAVILPAALSHLFLQNNFAAAFDFKTIFGYIGKNTTNYILGLLVMILAAIASYLGLIAFVIGIIFTAFWAGIVTYYTLAQVYRISQMSPGLMPEMPPPPPAPPAPLAP